MSLDLTCPHPFVQAFDGPSLLEPSPLVIPPFGVAAPLAIVPIVTAPRITPPTTKNLAQKSASVLSSSSACAAAIAAARRDCLLVSSCVCVLCIGDGSKSGSGLEEYASALNMPPVGPLLAEEDAEDVFLGEDPP